MLHRYQAPSIHCGHIIFWMELFNHNQQCFMKSKQKCLDVDMLPAHLPASEAAPERFKDYRDVNICGFDCIM